MNLSWQIHIAHVLRTLKNTHTLDIENDYIKMSVIPRLRLTHKTQTSKKKVHLSLNIPFEQK